jgi:hypothetical protein
MLEERRKKILQAAAFRPSLSRKGGYAGKDPCISAGTNTTYRIGLDLSLGCSHNRSIQDRIHNSSFSAPLHRCSTRLPRRSVQLGPAVSAGHPGAC